MSTKGEAYAGLSVAITTPFKNDEVDYAKLREQVEFQIAAGTKCVVPVGTTGESPTLSHDAWQFGDTTVSTTPIAPAPAAEEAPAEEAAAPNQDLEDL